MPERYGNADVKTSLRCAADFGYYAPHIIDPFVDVTCLSVRSDYDLPAVTYAKQESPQGNYRAVRRVFETPAGTLTDVTRYPPEGDRSYGITPNPFRSEHRFKSKDELKALAWPHPPVERAEGDRFFAADREIGEKGLLMMAVCSSINHRGGEAPPTEDLMVMFHDDRELFDEFLALFHQWELGGAREDCAAASSISLSTGTATASPPAGRPVSGKRRSRPISSACAT